MSFPSFHRISVVIFAVIACLLLVPDARAQAIDPPQEIASIGEQIHWGRYTASPDTVFIYVSSSEGDDHSARLNSRERPFRTLEAAMRRTGSNAPDWLLLKCGDTFDAAGAPGRGWVLSGRNPEEPLMVAGYGSGPRPRIAGLLTDYGLKGEDRFISNIVFYGVAFTEEVDIRTGGEHITFEDCLFEHCQLSIQGVGPVEGEPAMRDVTIRRCMFNNNYALSGRPQNLYAHLIDGLTVEGCFFWRGGWNPEVPGADADVYSHNVYVQYTTRNVVFRGNICADGSSHGAQLRSGGVCEGNLFLGNPIGVQIGSTSNKNYPDVSAAGVVRFNAILDARDINADLPRGHAIWIDNAGPLDVHHNIIAHQRRGTAAKAITVGSAYHDLRIQHNIVYDWAAAEHPERSTAFGLSGAASGENVIADNVVEIIRGGNVVEDRTDSPNWTFGNVRDRVSFHDPTRDVESYMVSLGLAGGMEEFAERCLGQRKAGWDDRFTATAVLQYIFEGFQECTSLERD